MKRLGIPVLLFAFPAILFTLVPAGQHWLLLDRTGVAQGELWRLWTGHWVHFSSAHLAWNVAVLLAAGTWLESVQPGRLWRQALLGAPIISLIILSGDDSLRAYGGLSALATGIVVLLALTQLERSRRDRLYWSTLLLLVLGKSVYDATHDTALFIPFGDTPARPAAMAHLTGAMVATLHFATSRILNRFPAVRARCISQPSP
jgi:rhomboid family GlyGly-CTERM serine protease